MVHRNMTKIELTEALSKELNLSTRTTAGIVSTILDSMTEALANGDNIEIRGFGSFTIKHYEPYTGRNELWSSLVFERIMLKRQPC